MTNITEKLKEKIDEKLPPSPYGYVYWRDRIVNGGRALGVIVVAVVTNMASIFVENMGDAKAALGLTGFILAAGVAVYLNESKLSKKRNNIKPDQPTNKPPQETEPGNGQANNP